MKMYYLWLNLMMAESCDKAIVSLVRAKFNVSADDRNIPKKNGKYGSTILFLILESKTYKRTEEVRDAIGKAFDEAEIKHFGFIVTPPVECAWNTSNIDMAKAIEERKQKILQSVHLQLVPSEPRKPEQEEIPDEPA